MVAPPRPDSEVVKKATPSLPTSSAYSRSYSVPVTPTTAIHQLTESAACAVSDRSPSLSTTGVAVPSSAADQSAHLLTLGVKAPSSDRSLGRSNSSTLIRTISLPQTCSAMEMAGTAGHHVTDNISAQSTASICERTNSPSKIASRLSSIKTHNGLISPPSKSELSLSKSDSCSNLAVVAASSADSAAFSTTTAADGLPAIDSGSHNTVRSLNSGQNFSQHHLHRANSFNYATPTNCSSNSNSYSITKNVVGDRGNNAAILFLPQSETLDEDYDC